MSTAFISEWASFTDTKVAVAGATAAYGGGTDWLGYWARNTKGGSDLTTFFLNLQTADYLNYEERVDWIQANDAPLLAQNNATTQPTQYPGTNTHKSYTPPAFTWNGYTWLQTS